MSAPVTERKLDNGWAAGPGVRIRQARPDDMDAVRELALLAGVPLEGELVDAVRSGAAGQALRTGLARGNEAFLRHMAEQFVTHWKHPLVPYLSAALCLVAERRDEGIVGALLAYPPPNISQDHLDAARGADDHQRRQLSMVGAIGLAKIKAVAVAEDARGLGIGSALLLRAWQVFFACEYSIVYGTMAATPGLDVFYRRNGFQVLDHGEPIDLWAVYGMHSAINADAGERFFIRYKPDGEQRQNAGARRPAQKRGKKR
jgi:GNAT superfamily N-acetyltransferase